MKKSDYMCVEVDRENERCIHYDFQRLDSKASQRNFQLDSMTHTRQLHQQDKSTPSMEFDSMKYHDLIADNPTNLNQVQINSKIDAHVIKDVYHYQLGDETLNELEVMRSLGEYEYIWKEIQQVLTKKAQNWLLFHVLEDNSLEVIARLKNVSLEEVESWGEEVKTKLETSIIELLISKYV